MHQGSATGSNSARVAAVRLNFVDSPLPSDAPVGESWFDLPAEVDEPLEVYLNGIPQQAGVDYRRVDRALVFPRSLKPEMKMSRFQLLLGTLGIAGTYDNHDSLDVVYHHDSRRLVATGLKPRESRR